MIRFAEISLGRGAGRLCRRCSPQTEPEFHSSEVVCARVAQVVAAWSDGPEPNVLFAGPEPFSHPELPAIVSGAVGMGVERIGLRTDAGALSMPGNAEGVLATGVRHLQVVSLAGCAEAHDGLTGRPGLFDAATAGVAAFTAAARASSSNVAITGLVPVCPHNLSDLPAAVAALARAGAVAIEIPVSPEAAGAKGFEGWVAAAVDTGLVNGVWVYVSGAPLECGLPGLHRVAPVTVSGAAS